MDIIIKAENVMKTKINNDNFANKFNFYRFGK